MPQENVEIVRRFFDALERSIDAWERSRSFADAIRTGEVPPATADVLRYVSPEMEWRSVFSSETYRGYLEIARGWDELLEVSADYRLELLEATSLTGDRVLVTFGPMLEGRYSGIQVNAGVINRPAAFVCPRKGQGHREESTFLPRKCSLTREETARSANGYGAPCRIVALSSGSLGLSDQSGF